MKLTDFPSDLKLSFDAVAADEELSTQIQRCLIALDLLDRPADGKFGPLTATALREFQHSQKLPDYGYFTDDTADALVMVETLPRPELELGSDLASRVVRYMLKKGYQVFSGSHEYTIFYVEGMNLDGSLNADNPNEFNDLRGVLDLYKRRKPRLIDAWEGTTEPGFKYTYKPMNSAGAARIAFGQYKAWRVGTHGNSEPHEALVQAAPVKVHRDANKDFVRRGDRIEEGLFGINQHWGYDYPKNDIGFASAGCLVGRLRAGHREFMRLIKQDRRFQLNPGYLFVTAVLPGDEL